MSTGRHWGPIAFGVGVTLTFLILVGLGTVEEPGLEPGPAPSAQGSPAPPAWMRPLRPGEQPPQFVLFSFDGAGSDPHWRRVLSIAAEADAHVTGFLSGTYLLTDDRRESYDAPGHGRGRAAISFGGSAAEVALRVEALNAAITAGHEIGTHYNGHFCRGNEPSAATWSTAQWRAELDQFLAFVRDAATRGLLVDADAIRGGRTPCLEGEFARLAPVLVEHGLTYDSSLTAEGVAWPSRRSGIWRFPVPVVEVPALDGERVVMQDYDLWYALNGARDEPARADEFTEAALDTYRAAYRAALGSNRAPLTVATHFNDWSGGAFSRATERFLAEVCVREQTVCATYSQVVAWLELQDPAVLDAFRARPPAGVG